MNKISNPWLALSTYSEKDELKFKGREKDTKNIVTILQQGDCVVCYAASGDGKSSLINAGVCPAIRRLGMFPVKITFTTAEYEGVGLPLKENNLIDFDKFIDDKIKENINLYTQKFIEENNIKDDYKICFEKETKYKDYEIDNNLWWKLRTETIQVPFGEFDYIPVLIFDQFEEMFRSKWKAEFFLWIENLMRDVCPQSIIKNIIKSGEAELPNKKLFKAIFSMRYEYVGELDYWCSQKTFIPSMMHSRYFLKPLSREQAISVICNQNSDDRVSLKMKDCADLIVDNIIASSSVMSGHEDEVSAIVLSLVCFVLFDEWSDNDYFSVTDMGLNQIIYDFYRDKLNILKVSDEHRRVLEDVLISTQKTRLRIPVSDERLQKIKIGNYLDREQNLVSEHILKKDTSNGENYIELIHDRLSDAIFKHRGEERTEMHEQAVAKMKREGFMLLAALFMLTILVCLTYYLFSTSNDDVIVVPKAVKENILVVNDEDYLSKSDSDYYNATSIEFRKNKYTCVNSLYYANNVIYNHDHEVFYAHNAKELVFLKRMGVQYQLDLGWNVEEVYILYPSNISSVKTKNNHTIIYVPYGEYYNCISNPIFDNVCIGRMSIFSTFIYHLMTYSAMDHLDIFCHIGFHFPMIFAVMLIVFVIGYIYERKKLLSIKDLLKFSFLCTFVPTFFYIIIWEISLRMDYSLKYIASWTCGMSLLCIIVYYLRPNLKRKLHKTRYCIIYNSTPNKKVAIALKQVLIENGIKEKDIRLDLSIVRHDVFYPDKAETCLLYSRHCIAIFDEDSFADTMNNKNYWELMPRKKHFIHPVIIGINKLEKKNVEKQKRWVALKNGSRRCFPTIYLHDEKITQQQLLSLISAMNKGYTPAAKKGCLGGIVIYIIFVMIEIIMLLICG